MDSQSKASQADLSALRIDRGPDTASRGENRSGGRSLRIVFIAIAAAAAIVAIGAFAVSRSGALAPQVAVGKARLRAGGGPSTILSANGYVVAQRKAAVASKATGRLAELFVEEGSTVKSGDILGRLEHADYDAEVMRTRSDYDAAKATLARSRADSVLAALEFDRQRRLLDAKLIDQSSYDQAKARFDVTAAGVLENVAIVSSRQAELAFAEANQEYTKIRAPFDATVLRKNAEVGEIVAPISVSGANARGAIVDLADMTSLEVEVDVNEAYIARIEIGQRAEVRLDAYADRPYAAFVRQIVPTANRQKATVVVKVAFDQLDRFVLPEMGAKVTFQATESKQADAPPPQQVFVPKEAVVERAGRSAVVVVENGRARTVPIEVGVTDGGEVEARTGLRGGETVVLSPDAELADGARVRVSAGG